MGLHHSSPAPTSDHRGGQVYQADVIRAPRLPKHSTASTRWTLNPASHFHVCIWRGSLLSTDWLSWGYGSLELLGAIFPDLVQETYEK